MSRHGWGAIEPAKRLHEYTDPSVSYAIVSMAGSSYHCETTEQCCVQLRSIQDDFIVVNG